MERDTCVQLSEESLSDARRLKDLLAGAGALLSAGGQTSLAAITGARSTVFESKAVADLLVDRLERFFAWQHEQDRAQAAKHISTAEARR